MDVPKHSENCTETCLQPELRVLYGDSIVVCVLGPENGLSNRMASLDSR